MRAYARWSNMRTCRVARTDRQRRTARMAGAGALVLVVLLSAAALLWRGGAPNPAVALTLATSSRTPSPTESATAPTASATAPTASATAPTESNTAPLERTTAPTGGSDPTGTRGTGTGTDPNNSALSCPPLYAVDIVTTGEPGWFSATFAPDEYYAQACRDVTVQVMWVTYTRDGEGNLVYAAGATRALSATSPTWTFETLRLATGCFHYYVVAGDLPVRDFLPASEVGPDELHDPLYDSNGTEGRVHWGWSSDCATVPSI